MCKTLTYPPSHTQIRVPASISVTRARTRNVMGNVVTNSIGQSWELKSPCHTFAFHAHGIVCLTPSLFLSLSEEDVMQSDRNIKINNEQEVC